MKLRLAVLSVVVASSPLAAIAQEAAPAVEPEAVAEPSPAAEPAMGGSAQAAIDRGLSAYWRHNWSAAAAEFQAAVDADPQSAAAAFYLGYAIYKQAEFRPFHPDKERAREMFARAFELDPTFSPTFQRSGR